MLCELGTTTSNSHSPVRWWSRCSQHQKKERKRKTRMKKMATRLRAACERANTGGGDRNKAACSKCAEGARSARGRPLRQRSLQADESFIVVVHCRPPWCPPWSAPHKERIGPGTSRASLPPAATAMEMVSYVGWQLTCRPPPPGQAPRTSTSCTGTGRWHSRTWRCSCEKWGGV